MYDGNKTDIKCFQEEYKTNNPEKFDIGLKNHTNVRKCCSAFPEFISLGVSDFKDNYRIRYVRHQQLPTHRPQIKREILELFLHWKFVVNKKNLLLIISLKRKSAVTTVVSICMYVRAYVYVYICMCVCLYVHMYVCMYVCTSIMSVYASMYYVCTHARICIRIYICIYIYVYIYVCLWVCMYVCMYAYEWVFTWSESRNAEKLHSNRFRATHFVEDHEVFLLTDSVEWSGPCCDVFGCFIIWKHCFSCRYTHTHTHIYIYMCVCVLNRYEGHPTGDHTIITQ